MTTKTENLEAWEALMLLMEGVVLHDRLGCKWTDKALSRDSHGLSTTIAFLIDCAPFRLAEPKKTAHEANELIKALDCITDETRPLDCVDIAEKIYAAIHQEARKIAQEEVKRDKSTHITVEEIQNIARSEINHWFDVEDVQLMDKRAHLQLDSRMRETAKEEIAKLRQEIGYGTINISGKAIAASKDDSWLQKLKEAQEKPFPKVTFLGQDRHEAKRNEGTHGNGEGEPNE